MSEFSPQPWPIAATLPAGSLTIGTVQAISGAQARLTLDSAALAEVAVWEDEPAERDE